MDGQRVVFVTGSGRGIGRGTAIEFARRRYDVVVHEREVTPEARDVVRQIRELGCRAELITGDLMESGVPVGLVDEVVAIMGRIDVLVNNAGISVFRPFLRFSEDDFDAVFRTNYRAPYWCAQRAAEWMKKMGDGGSIVNIASVHMERTNDGDSMYGSMKAALVRLTESMAYELAPHGIRVNGVAPGLILTSDPEGEAVQRILDIEKAIPLGRTGRPVDIARVVCWLASEEAGYVTGVTVRADGGMNLPLTRAVIDGKQTFF